MDFPNVISFIDISTRTYNCLKIARKQDNFLTKYSRQFTLYLKSITWKLIRIKWNKRKYLLSQPTDNNAHNKSMNIIGSTLSLNDSYFISSTFHLKQKLGKVYLLNILYTTQSENTILYIKRSYRTKIYLTNFVFPYLGQKDSPKP